MGSKQGEQEVKCCMCGAIVARTSKEPLPKKAVCHGCGPRLLERWDGQPPN